MSDCERKARPIVLRDAIVEEVARLLVERLGKDPETASVAADKLAEAVTVR